MRKIVVTYARGLKEEVLARASESYDAGLTSDLGNIRGFPDFYQRKARVLIDGDSES